MILRNHPVKKNVMLLGSFLPKTEKHYYQMNQETIIDLKKNDGTTQLKEHGYDLFKLGQGDLKQPRSRIFEAKFLATQIDTPTEKPEVI